MTSPPGVKMLKRLLGTDPQLPGEQPLFTTLAHVFQIDPKTKKNWLPSSQTAVSVSFFYDTSRNAYRIISVEGTKAIINSTVTPSMTFTKTSQKFGQWTDHRANTVYGLGFGTEAELSKFIEKFKEVKDATRVAAQKAAASGGGGSGAAPTLNGNTDLGRDGADHLVNEVISSAVTASSSPPPSHRLPPSGDSPHHARSVSASNSPHHNPSSLPPSPASAADLSHVKYENDRLKVALAQSKANAKKWEVELQTLKNNNARLTAALQESTANVEEWKRQLQHYKEEAHRLKAQAQGSNNNLPATEAESSEEVTGLKAEVARLESELSSQRKTSAELESRLTQVPAETSTNSLQANLKVLHDENEALKGEIVTLKDRGPPLPPEVRQMELDLGKILAEACRIHERLSQALREHPPS